MSSLGDQLRAAGGEFPKTHRPPVPVWKGPEQDGVTFSLLSRFLACRERFRHLVINGLQSAEGFDHKIEFGNMWHLCEEALASGRDPTNKTPLWETRLTAYARQLCATYPTQQPQVDHWYNICRVQFPVYIDFWRRQKDVVERTPIFQEQVFSLEWLVEPGSVRSALLTGMLGLQPRPVVAELAGYLLYAIPMLLVVLLSPVVLAQAPKKEEAVKADLKELEGIWEGYAVEGKGEDPDHGPIHLRLTISGTKMSAVDLGKAGKDMGSGTYKIDPTRPVRQRP